MPGQELTYTLTLRNDSADAVVTGAVVTDDVSDVLDDAALASSAQELADQGLGHDDTVGAERLTWTVAGPVAPGGTATATYRVTVDEGAWGRLLVNTATPDGAGECRGGVEKGAGHDGCTTTTGTTPVTTLVVKKVDADDTEESPSGLPGAEFVLYVDHAPYADPADPQVGDEDVALGFRTTDVDGLAKWGELLKGHYLLQETEAPEGYDLPESALLAVEIHDGNFVAGGEMAPIVFRDGALGDLLLTKAQLEREDGVWTESDGIVEHGDLLKYTLHLDAFGGQRFHDVVVSDWVPGHDPADEVSTAAATLVPGSATCVGEVATCTVSVDGNGLVTWELGDLEGGSVDLEMVVRFPDVPDRAHYDRRGEFRTVLWNMATAEWMQVVGNDREQTDLQGMATVSNEVVAEAVAHRPGQPVLPPPPGHHPSSPGQAPQLQGALPGSGLPDTGLPANLLPLALLGATAVGLGVALVGRGRRRDEEGSTA
jgi:LPXTG-motif cell wall-anchored protein